MRIDGLDARGGGQHRRQESIDGRRDAPAGEREHESRRPFFERIKYECRGDGNETKQVELVIGAFYEWPKTEDNLTTDSQSMYDSLGEEADPAAFLNE